MDPQEALYILRTFMSDLNDIKTTIYALWSKYSNNKLDLATVAIATNAYITVARQLETARPKQTDLDGLAHTSKSSMVTFTSLCPGAVL